MTQPPLPRSVWIPVLALALVIFGWRLNTVPLTNWDEGIYANVNLELSRSPDWGKLTYFGADFLEKPPLQFWVTSWLFSVFGPTEFAVRLLPALAGVATALVLALWAWQATRQRWVALSVGLVFGLGRFALVHAFRTGDLDGLLTFFITWAMYGYWRSWTMPGWIVLWGAASAAAVMTKSVVGLLPVIIVGLDVLLTRGWRTIGWKNMVVASGVFLALVVPWHIVETVRFGRAFWDSYLGVHVIERTTESLFTTTPWDYYLGIIRDRFAPFSWLLPLALVTAGWKIWKEKNNLHRLLIVWLVVTFAVFTFIQTRREWYIVPLYPAAALLVATVFQSWWRDRQSRWIQLGFLLSAVGAFGHLLTDTYLRLAINHLPFLRQLSTPFWRSVSGQILLGVIVVGGLVVAAWRLRKKMLDWWRWTLVGSGGMMVLTALAASLLYIHALPSSLPLKTIAARIAQAGVNDVSLVGTRLKKQPAGYFYLLRLDAHSTEYVAGTAPPTPVVLTTTEPQNAPLNTRGKRLADEPPFLLLDLR